MRIFSVGESTSIVTVQKSEGKDYLRTNPQYLYQYYPRLNSQIPTPESYVFEKEAPDSVFRIYVIGESTSQGFPYSKTEAFPFQIQQRLNAFQHEKHVEVVNFSISAVSSYIGYDIAKEIVRFPPDLVILYFGNNDFVGIGGSTSFDHVLFKANRIFSRLRIYQSIKLLASSVQKKKEAISTFEQMAQKEEVGYHSDRYKETVEAFGQNYEKMIKIFQKHNISVLSLGVTVNLKDMPPFKVKKDLTAIQYGKVRELLMQEISKSGLSQIVRIIGENPKANFIVAKELLRQKKPTLAKYFYEKACDFDLLRFRATSEIKEKIKNISEINGCYYVNLQEVFDKHSEGDIAGNDLFCEHVHPLLKGHTLIADTLSDFVFNKFFSGVTKQDAHRVPILHSMVDQMEAINTLDGMYASKLFKEIHYINLNPRKELFDIKGEDETHVGFILKEDVDKDAFNFIKDMFGRRLSRTQMHVNYGCWLTEKGKGKEAMLEFQVATLLNPDDYHSENNMAILEYKLGQKEKAFQRISKLQKHLSGKDKFVSFNYNYMGKELDKPITLNERELKQLNMLDEDQLIYLLF